MTLDRLGRPPPHAGSDGLATSRGRPQATRPRCLSRTSLRHALRQAGGRRLRHRRRRPPSSATAIGRHTFGQSALLARRLVEAGTPFVTVNCVPWDHHGTAPQLKTEEGASKLIPPLDRAISGARRRPGCIAGSYESTLVVAMGEFGRTPRMNRDAGRDHWGRRFQRAHGLRINANGPGHRPEQRPRRTRRRPAITPQDVAATVYHHLGIDARATIFEDRAGRPSYLIENGEPIRELVG